MEMCSHSSTEMSLKDIVDKICQKCFDFLEEFSQYEMNCLISCTIDGQNNLVNIIIIIERNDKLIFRSKSLCTGLGRLLKCTDYFWCAIL